MGDGAKDGCCELHGREEENGMAQEEDSPGGRVEEQTDAHRGRTSAQVNPGSNGGN
jgi:hypothetical protein